MNVEVSSPSDFLVKFLLFAGQSLNAKFRIKFQLTFGEIEQIVKKELRKRMKIERNSPKQPSDLGQLFTLYFVSDNNRQLDTKPTFISVH